jgi:hypothetical protein
MLTIRSLVAGTLCVLFLVPSLASAQAPSKAGVVTTLEGNVTATRATAPPVPLRFKDDVLIRDRITTAEQSLARMLLGGKAVVTVRERSVLTITEVPGRSMIEIDSGKFALAVARERMRPGEVIEIRTPNAIAGVRGSVIVTEVHSAPGARTPESSLSVITGTLDAQPKDPTTQTGIGTPRTLNAMEQFRVLGLLGSVSAIRPDQLGAIRSGLQPKGGPKHKEPQNQQQLTAQQMQTATSLAQGLVGPGGAEGLFATSNPTPPQPTTPEPTVAVAPLTPITNPEVQQVLLSPPITTTSGTFSGGGKIPLVGGLLVNPGFENGDFAGWTVSGAGAVISSFGTLTPAEGNFFALIHTRTGQTLSGCGFGNECTKSTLSQTFNVNSVVTVSARGFLISNEFPTFTGSQSQFADLYRLLLTDASGQTFTLFETNVNQLHTSFKAAGFAVNVAGFSLSGSGGVFELDLPKKTQVVASGPATLLASVSNVSDTALDSAFIADAVLVTQDPPLFFITGGTFAQSGTLRTFSNETSSFDSLLMACCGASVTLGGPALVASNSVLDVPFGAVHAIQGGRILSTSSGPLVQLDGGTYALGTITSVFSAAGITPDGSDEPLRHGGTFLDATNASVKTSNVMIVDTALLAATAPLLNLKSSSVTATDSVLDLSFRAKVSSLGPVVALNNSLLTVGVGPLVNVRNGSSLFVNGDLVHLSNGSTLSLLNGPLASVSGNSILNVSGALVSFTGGGNSLNVTNNLCSTFGCSNLGGLNVVLTGGASAANVNISNPIKGAGAFNIAPNAAAMVISGAGSKVNVGN